MSQYFPGYSTDYAYNGFIYRTDRELITLDIYEEGQYFSKNLMGSLKRSFTKKTDGHTEYYYRTNTYSDESLAGGTTYTWVVLSANGYDIALTGIGPGTQDTSAVTFGLLVDLLAGKDVEGLEYVRQVISAKLTDGSLWCNVEIDSEKGQDYSELQPRDSETLQRENGIGYILSTDERQPDDPNGRYVICKTNSGLLQVFCGVQYDDRNNVSSEELDFINFTLAKDIAAHLGLTIVSIEDASNAEDETEILHKKTLSWSDDPWKSFAETVDELYKDGKNGTTEFDIPVYFETDLLFDTNGMYFLGRDAGYYAGTNAMPNEAGAILATYPTDAIRTKENGAMYTIHDTDTGYRLYLFFDKNNDYSIPVGFPVVIKELLSYSDFSGLKTGDPIEAVEKIDPVATLHKRTITEVWKLNPTGAANYAAEGVPCTSIHYLKDGLLAIEYEMPENGDLVISGIKYSENYILTDILGNDIDYSIYEIDLPNR